MKNKASLLKWNKELGADMLFENKPINRVNEKVPEIKQKAMNVNKSELKEKATANVNKDELRSREIVNRISTLVELKNAVENSSCCDLKKSANKTVFADGNPSADIMLIGEAPGANEDKEGIPFCGQSGKLLNNILPSIGYQRENVYITNTVFWRPPGNRRPTSQEIAICRPFVEKHIALIKPKLILLVGSTAVESLLGNKFPMHSLRENYYDYKNEYLDCIVKTAVIFHPSYLLRQPLKKKLMWNDMQKIKRHIKLTNANKAN